VNREDHDEMKLAKPTASAACKWKAVAIVADRTHLSDFSQAVDVACCEVPAVSKWPQSFIPFLLLFGF
jgi:hypothetical protein